MHYRSIFSLRLLDPIVYDSICANNKLFFFRAPLGLDITSEVKDAAIKVPPLKLRINS